MNGILSLKRRTEKRRTWRPRVKNNEYLLSGILTCSKCNHKYNGVSSISNHRTNKKKRLYRCSGPQVGRVSCTNTSIKAEDIEPEVTKIIAQLVENDRLKQYRCMSVTLPKSANFPNFGKSTKIDATSLRNKLEENHQ
ncbi:MAG: zinc ribbon domain-containing protein, partial [Candidatus Omnitrophica bacterium]|nr:zinc ribbon domain-containing protein [Candidatus Omnitrophota bacterium]